MPPADDVAPDTNGASAAADPSKAAAQGRQQRLEQASVADHFVVGIYPFFHGVEIGDEPALRREGETGRVGRALPAGLFGPSGLWASWLTRLPQHETLGALGAFDDSYFFLPHVRTFLHPEFHGYEPPAPDVLRRRLSYDDATIRTQLEHRVQELARVADQEPEAFAALVGRGRSVHLTLRPDVLAPLARFTLAAGQGPDRARIPARLVWADLWLFPYGVGQVVLLLQRDVEPAPKPGTAVPTDLAWLDALLAPLALIHPRYVGDEGHAFIQVPGRQTPLPLRTLLDFLLQGVAGLPPGGPETQAERAAWKPTRTLTAYAGEWEEASKSPTAAAYGTVALPYSLTDAGQVHGARLLTYAYVRAPAQKPDPALGIPGWTASEGFPEAWQQLGLETGLRQPWLRAAGAQHDGDGSYLLDASWVARQGVAGHTFRRYRNWAALAYHESFLAVALESDGFTGSYDAGLSKNLYHDYLNLYVYVVFVRFALLRFTERMQRPAPRALRGAAEEDHETEALERLRRLHEQFLLFRRSHWFARATSRDQGEELRGLMMNALGVQTDYAHIEQTLDDVVEALEVRGERERNRRIHLLTVWFAPLTLVLALFSTKLVDLPNTACLWGTFAALALGALGITRLLVRSKGDRST